MKKNEPKIHPEGYYACSYVKFQSPVPRMKDKEPMYELKLEATHERYRADSLTYTPHGFLVKIGVDQCIVPLANVNHARIA
jgi:hypothetical protein